MSWVVNVNQSNKLESLGRIISSSFSLLCASTFFPAWASLTAVLKRSKYSAWDKVAGEGVVLVGMLETGLGHSVGARVSKLLGIAELKGWGWISGSYGYLYGSCCTGYSAS